MYTNLEHLSSLEVDKIKKRYYNGESVAKLIAEYQLNIAPAFLYKLLPPDTVKKWGCGRCRVNLVVDSVARSGSQQMTDPMRFYCPVCRRRPFRDNHGWFTFPLLSDDEIMQKQEIIKAHYGKPLKPVDYASLSFSGKRARKNFLNYGKKLLLVNASHIYSSVLKESLFHSLLGKKLIRYSGSF